MGAYSDSVTSNAGYNHDFFTSLTCCLSSGIGAVKDLAMLELSVDTSPDLAHLSGPWSQDRLVAYKGVPLLAVAIRVEPSSANRAIKTTEYTPAVAPMSTVNLGFKDRLKAADTVDAPKPVEVPKRVMTELLWRITLRLPSGEEKVYTGDCFDFNGVEMAFDAIADVVEAAIKSARAQP